MERLAARHSFGDAHARRQHSGQSAHAKVMMWDMSAPESDGAMLPPPISGRGAAPCCYSDIECFHLDADIVTSMSTVWACDMCICGSRLWIRMREYVQSHVGMLCPDAP